MKVFADGTLRDATAAEKAAILAQRKLDRAAGLPGDPDAELRAAYAAEADGLFFKWQALLAAGDPGADEAKSAWLSSRSAVKARFAPAKR